MAEPGTFSNNISLKILPVIFGCDLLPREHLISNLLWSIKTTQTPSGRCILCYTLSSILNPQIEQVENVVWNLIFWAKKIPNPRLEKYYLFCCGIFAVWLYYGDMLINWWLVNCTKLTYSTVVLYTVPLFIVPSLDMAKKGRKLISWRESEVFRGCTTSIHGVARLFFLSVNLLLP